MTNSIAPQCLHISDYGKRLKRYKGMLRVDWTENGEDFSLTFSPANLKQVILSGEHTITTGAVGILLKYGVDLTFLDSYGEPAGYLFPVKRGQMLNVWEKQIEMDEKCALDIARQILVAASGNKVSILEDVERNRGLNMERHTGKMLDLIGSIDDAEGRNNLMGLEGAISNEYFKALQTFIPDILDFRGRFRRPAPDVVNVMFNYGYGILYSFIRNAIAMVGLNPYKGVLHASYKDQEALHW
jgi:CRISPR-associated protein Cas1